MSYHTLTETATFTPSVSIPDNNQVRNTADLDPAIGAVANRTQYLKPLADGAAQKAAANVFTAGPQEVSVNDATVAALVTRKTPADDPHADNKWKLVQSHAFSSTEYMNAFVGDISAEGQYILTLNATWDPATLLWSKDNAGHDALALIFTQNGAIRASRRTGAGTWATWPTTLGELNAPVVSSPLFDWAPDITFTDSLPLAGSYGAIITTLLGDLGFTSSPAVIYTPIRIPRFVTPGTLHVSFYQDTTTPMVFTIKERTIDFTTPGFAGLTSTGFTVSGSASGGAVQLETIDLSGWLPDRSKEYVIVAQNGSSNDFIQGYQLTGNIARQVAYGIGG